MVQADTKVLTAHIPWWLAEYGSDGSLPWPFAQRDHDAGLSSAP